MGTPQRHPANPNRQASNRHRTRPTQRNLYAPLGTRNPRNPHRKGDRMNGVMEEWMTDHSSSFKQYGICRDHPVEMFFPLRGQPAKQAMKICNGTDKRPGCPVKQQCLEYALSLPNFCVGIWGGSSQKERRRIKAERERQHQLEAGQPVGNPIRFKA